MGQRQVIHFDGEEYEVVRKADPSPGHTPEPMTFHQRYWAFESVLACTFLATVVGWGTIWHLASRMASALRACSTAILVLLVAWYVRLIYKYNRVKLHRP